MKNCLERVHIGLVLYKVMTVLDLFLFIVHKVKLSYLFQGLLGPKKELWDILQFVEKYAIEAQDITASVRDLPTVR